MINIMAYMFQTNEILLFWLSMNFEKLKTASKRSELLLSSSENIQHDYIKFSQYFLNTNMIDVSLFLFSIIMN